MKELSKQFIAQQKESLMAEKSRLENELKGIEKFPQYGTSVEDNSEEVEDFTTSQGQEKQLLEMLANVKNALDKIEKGEYGYCENCGKKKLIDIDRLKALPAAATCIKCDTKK